MPAERRLSHLLLASHVVLVLLLAALLLLGAADAVRGAVLGQARVQVEQGIVEARARLREWRRELNVGAGLLAEQSALASALANRRHERIAPLLADFVQTSGLAHLRVLVDESVIAAHGSDPPAGNTALPLQAGWWFDGRGESWRIEQAAVAGVEGARVLAAGRIGNRLQSRPPLDFVTVALLPLSPSVDAGERASAAAGPPAGPAAEWQEALAAVSGSGDPETLDGLHDHAVARIVSVRDESGRPVALLAARIEPQWIAQRVREWLGRFGLMVVGALGVALVLAAWWSRRIARPFAQLVRAAAPLGEGQLESPIVLPATRLAEARSLGAQLEALRQRVQSLAGSERAQRQQLDAVLDGVDAGIASVDGAQQVRYANRQFQALLGAGADVVGQSLPALLAADRSGIDWPAGPGRERMRATAGGPPLVLRRMAAAVDGSQILVLRPQSSEEAAGALRDHILANLSHEFQTPLAAQMASIELLREHLRSRDDRIATQLADAQFRGALRLSQLVDNLLDSVRIDSGEMRLRRQPVDLAALVRDAVDLLAPLIEQREQQVQVHLPPCPRLQGDPQRLFSVIVNLLSNANKYAPDRSTVTVALAQESDAVTLQVSDEGPGLPDWPHAADLFAPLRRAPDDEPGQRGSGLGLAIVRAIVLAHGGTVQVASPAKTGSQVAVGACIVVRLPLEGPCAS